MVYSPAGKEGKTRSTAGQYISTGDGKSLGLRRGTYKKNQESSPCKGIGTVGDLSSDFALALSAEMLWTALYVSAPVLGFSMLIGLLISMFQVVTQIQETTLTFVPKILVVGITLLVFGSWMLGMIVSFASTVIGNIPMYF
jgi:flagellar biosynthesis protein FliQ